MNTSPSGAHRAITQSEAKQSLSHLLDDLARHVGYLIEEGVTEIACPPVPACPSSARGSAGESMPGNTRESPSASTVPNADPSVELRSIAQTVAACKKCPLHAKRRQAVPGQGSSNPDILFVGEGPGEDEDRQGLAFVGRAGQLLTRLITRMGYTRDQVFIANVVKCRPPDNRKPLPDEMAACFPYLKAQIAALQPKVIVVLGATAMEALVSPLARISRMRGNWQTFGDIPLMPTYHPSYLLRNQSAMWDVWSDMQQVLSRLDRTAPAPAKAK